MHDHTEASFSNPVGGSAYGFSSFTSSGDLLYGSYSELTPGQGYVVLDASVPGALSLVGSIPNLTIFSGTFNGGTVVNGIHFIGAEGIGLMAIDVSDPTSPFILDTLASVNVGDVAVDGDTLYVADSSFVRIFDLDGFTAFNTASLGAHVHGGAGQGVAIRAGYAYNMGNGLEVIDVSDPGATTTVTTVATVGFGTGGTSVLNVDLLYTSRDGGQLEIFDLTVPGAPVSVGTLGSGYPAELQGNVLYVRGNNFTFPSQISWYDVSTPASPTLIDTLSIVPGLGLQVSSVSVTDSHVFVDDVPVGSAGCYAVMDLCTVLTSATGRCDVLLSDLTGDGELDAVTVDVGVDSVSISAGDGLGGLRRFGADRSDRR